MRVELRLEMLNAILRWILRAILLLADPGPGHFPHSSLNFRRASDRTFCFVQSSVGKLGAAD